MIIEDKNDAASGLDPVVRDDVLDMLLDFVQDEEYSILVSSHITSEVVFEKPKDELTERYGISKCGAAQFDALDKSDIISYRKMDYEWLIPVSYREKMQKKYPKALVVPATIASLVVLGFGLSFLLETSALLVLAPVAATTAAFS